MSTRRRRTGPARPGQGGEESAPVRAYAHITTAADDAALLSLFGQVRQAYAELTTELATSHRPCAARRLLSKRRATYRAALTLTFALAEQAAEAKG